VGNLIANSDWFRSRLSTEFGKQGLDASFDRVSFWPWSGLTAHDVTVRYAEVGELLPLSNFGRVRIRPRWSTIFDKTIVLDDISMFDPSTNVVQLRDGSLALPIQPRSHTIVVRKKTRSLRPDKPTQNPKATIPDESKPTQTPPSEAQESPDDPEVAEADPETDKPDLAPPKPRDSDPKPSITRVAPKPVPTAKTQPEPEGRGILLQPIGRKLGLGSLNLRGGDFHFHSHRVLNADVPVPVFSVRDYRVELKDLNTERPTGRLLMDSIKLFEVTVAQDIAMDVKVLDGGHLRIENMRADALGGEVSGIFEADLMKIGTPFLLRLNALGLAPPEFVRLLARFGIGVGVGEAPLDISIEASGYASVPESVTGRIQIRSRDLIVDVPADLQKIQSQMQVRSFEDRVKIDSVDATLTIQGRTVQVDDLSVRTKHAIVRSRGRIGSTGELDLRARLYVTNEVAHFLWRAHQRTPAALRPKFEPLQHTTWLVQDRDIRIGGTIDQPRSDIWVPGVMVTISELLKTFSSLSPARDR